MTETILTMDNGSQWTPVKTTESIGCASCDNIVDTPEEVASYPNGNCPQCGNTWTGAESKHVQVFVASPEPIGGGVL